MTKFSISKFQSSDKHFIQFLNHAFIILGILAVAIDHGMDIFEPGYIAALLIVVGCFSVLSGFLGWKGSSSNWYLFSYIVTIFIMFGISAAIFAGSLWAMTNGENHLEEACKNTNVEIK